MGRAVLTAIFAITMFILLVGCAEEETNQVQADLPIDKGNVAAGMGSNVIMKGDVLAPTGIGVIEVGKPLPAATLSSNELKPINIAANRGKVRIISVVPSLDTPTCDVQTHE